MNRIDKHHPWRQIAYSVLFGLLVLASWPAAFAAVDGESSAPIEQQILDRLASGGDTTELLAQLVAKREALGMAAPSSPRQGRFEEALATLTAAIDDGESAAIDTAYRELETRDRQLRDEFTEAAQRLQELGVGGEIFARLDAARERYLTASDQLHTVLAAPLASWRAAGDTDSDDKTSLAPPSLTAAKATAKTLLDSLSIAKPLRILGAQVLPFRRTGLAPRAPVTTPTIVPSYLDATGAVPQPEDLTASVAAPLNEEILRQAEALGYDYVRVYEYVRNTIATEPYAGSMKGALGTLRAAAGNDIDQASLLIALLRASQVPARYVHGVIELPIENAAATLGLADATDVTPALTRAGVAFSPVIRGGRVAAVEIEHTWVSARVPYTNYRGAVVDDSGHLWVPLAPALKDVATTPSTAVLRTMGLDVDAFHTDYLATPQPLGVVETLRAAVESHLFDNQPGATYEEQLGSSSLVVRELGLLPSTLPVPVVAITGESPTLDSARLHRLRLVAREGTGDDGAVVLDVELPLADAVGQRLTLSYTPATVDDHNVVNAYGGLSSVPVYLVKLRPQIKIDGRPRKVGEGALDMGAAHRFEIEMRGPYGNERLEQTVITGSYQALAIGAQQVTRVAEDDDPADTENLAARLLSSIAYGYGQRWDAAEAQLAGLLDVVVVRPLPSVAIASNEIAIDTAFGLPWRLRWQGVSLDAALRVTEPFASTDDAAAARDWMRLAALAGSALEHSTFEDEFLVESVSTDKGLALARQAGLPVPTLDAGNAASLLPTLMHPPAVIDDISAWIERGFTVEVPSEPLTLNAWSGAVWRVEEPATGAAGYFLAGGLAGGATTVPPSSWVLDFAAQALQAPYANQPNNDPLAAAEISKVPASDRQDGTVDEIFALPLEVLARDNKGRPVAGAEVIFAVAAGGGQLIDGQDEAPSLTVTTDAAGIARVRLRAGARTADNPVYVLADPGDEFATQALLHRVEAIVTTATGVLALETPFEAIAHPDEPDTLRRSADPGIGGTAGTWAETMQVMVEDQHGNPVSNVPVDFSVGPAQQGCDPPADPLQNAVVFNNRVDQQGRFVECGSPSPVLGECGSSTLRSRTSVRGAAAGVILGNAVNTVYRVQISTPSVVDPLDELLASFGACEEGPAVRFATSPLIDEFGANINAARAGEIFGAPVQVTLYYSVPDDEVRRRPNGDYYLAYLPSLRWERTTGQVQFSVSNGGSALGTIFVGNGTYESRIDTGEAPGINEVTVDATDIQMTVRTVDPRTGDVSTETQTAALSAVLTAITGLDPTVTGATPTPIQLTDSGVSRDSVRLDYDVAPDTYRAFTVDVDLLADDEVIGSSIGSGRAGAGFVDLQRGLRFEVDKTYEAELVINRGSAAEVRSDRLPLEIFQRLFTRVSEDVYLSQEVDLLNERACESGGLFTFSTSQEATITLSFRRIESQGPDGSFGLGSPRTLIDQEVFPAGDHEHQILPRDLPPGDYVFELRGVSASDGHEETRDGKARVEHRTRNELPVGHAMAKGVDLFDGHLVVTRRDLAVPGRGKSLELVRFYSSNSGTQAGPLGVGWSHNYDSKIVITPCAELIVSGAAGGGMRFVDDGQNGLRPLKGSHGSLVANPDGSFDFYSTDGTLYHYTSRKQNVWHLDYIEDPNGNRTTLTYAISFGEPRVVSVQEPAGRVFAFFYERRTFNLLTFDVITRVEGPAGLEMSFEYDAWGNLVRAARENGSRVEVYGFGDAASSFTSRHHLTSVRNDIDGSTTEYTYDQGAVGLLGEVVPSVFVSQITEPEQGVTRFEFDTGALLSRGPPELTTTVYDRRGQPTFYTLNQYGSPLRIEDPVSNTTEMTWATDDVHMLSRTDGNGNVTTFTYDAYGNPTSETITVTDVDGVSHDYTIETTYWPPTTFDRPYLKNRVHTRTDRNGVVTRHEYDGRGNLTRREVVGEGFVERHTYAANGDRLTTTDANLELIRFGYDAWGNLDSVRDPLGGEVTTVWDQRGQPIERRDQLRRLTRTFYDTLGRTIRVVHPDNSQEETIYDDAARLTTQIDAENRTTGTTFDREGRVLRTVDPLGNSKSYAYDLEGNKTLESNWYGNGTVRHDTTFVYDNAGRLTTRLEPLGRVTRYDYDGESNAIRETLESTGAEPFAPRITEYDYDELNRQHTVRRFLGATPVVTDMLLDGKGNVLRERDPLQRPTTFEYDGLDRLVRRVDALGGETVYEYDEVGNLTLERDPLQRERRRRYDALGRMTQRFDATGEFTAFEYDAVGNLTRQIDPRLSVTRHEYSLRDFRERTIVEVNLGSNPVGQVITESEYDRVGNQTEIRLANGQRLVQVFDGRNRRVSVRDDLGPISNVTYDANGNAVEEIDANRNVTSRTFDALDRLVQEDLPENRSLSFGYDAAGNRVRQTDALGRTTRFVYDTLDRLESTIDPAPFSYTVSYGYDLVGNRTRETNRRGLSTVFQYDDLDRVVAIIDPPSLGTSQSFTYDRVGNRLSSFDRRDILSEWRYDDENRVVRTTRAGVVVERLEYDAAGNVRFRIDANGNSTGYEYDERNLLIAENRPLAAISLFTLDAMGDRIETRDPEGRVESRVYDERRRLMSLANGANEVTTFTYDDNGNQTGFTRPEQNGSWVKEYDGADRLVRVIDPLLNETVYGYDANGNRTSITNAEQHTTTFEFDELNRLRVKIFAGGVDREQLDYDANGNLSEVVDAKGQVTTYDYDPLDRRVLAVFGTPTPATGDDLQTIDYVYDANGNLLSTSEVYGGATGQRVTTRTWDDFDRLVTVTDPEAKTITYTYDANGNRVQLRDPDGRVTVYTYDTLNRLETVTLAQVGVAEYEYYRNSWLREIRYPNGTRSRYHLDLANRVTRIESTQGAAALISRFDYTYDRNSNRATQTETYSGSAPEVTTYTYDAADRLTEVMYPDNTSIYTYDGVGNRLSEMEVDAGGTTLADKSFTYDPRERLTDVSNLLDPAQSVTYGHDANGNQVSRSQAGTVTDFVYDIRDQLVEIQNGGTLVERYLYNAEGLRVRKAGSGQILRYVYDDRSVLLQSDDFGNTVAKYDYGSDRLLSLAHVSEGRQYYLFDALGSVVNLTRPDGAIQARYQYDAWGNPRATVGASANPFGFTGQERDDATGLYYFKARYYDPEVGRFLNQDPQAGDVDNPPSLHKYLYAYANPTVFVDPTGEVAETVWDVASLAIGLVSLGANLADGKFADAALDAVGVVADAAAVAVPFVPGGAGALIKAGRVAKKAGDAIGAAQASRKVQRGIDAVQAVDQTANVVQGTKAAVENFEQGKIGWGTLNAAMAVLGVKQAKSNLQAVAASTKPAAKVAKVRADPPAARTTTTPTATVTGAAARGGTTTSTSLSKKSFLPEISTSGEVKDLARRLSGGGPAPKKLDPSLGTAGKATGATGHAGADLSGSGIKTWNEFQKEARGIFTRDRHLQGDNNLVADAASGWKEYKNANRSVQDLVIGRLDDIEALPNPADFGILNSSRWTVGVNAAWVKGGIDRRARFRLATPVEPRRLWNAARNEPSVYAQELKQLEEAGYRRVGEYMEPPPLK